MSGMTGTPGGGVARPTIPPVMGGGNLGTGVIPGGVAPGGAMPGGGVIPGGVPPGGGIAYDPRTDPSANVVMKPPPGPPPPGTGTWRDARPVRRPPPWMPAPPSRADQVANPVPGGGGGPLPPPPSQLIPGQTWPGWPQGPAVQPGMVPARPAPLPRPKR
jgi:hypothetical protein